MAVADDELSFDLTLSGTVEKIVAIALHMRLAALHLQSFFHDGDQRELVSHAAINAGNRNLPSFAAGENRLFESRGAISAKAALLLHNVDHISVGKDVRINPNRLNEHTVAATPPQP